jgi:hypothetical protein
MTAVDHSGRIADRTIIRAMSWHAAIRLDMYEQNGLIVVRPNNRGSHGVNSRGYLPVPSAIRQWCGLAAGERVLVVADPVAHGVGALLRARDMIAAAGGRLTLRDPSPPTRRILAITGDEQLSAPAQPYGAAYKQRSHPKDRRAMSTVVR